MFFIKVFSSIFFKNNNFGSLILIQLPHSDFYCALCVQFSCVFFSLHLISKYTFINTR